MKAKLAALLFLLTPAVQYSTEYYMEMGMMVWETELVKSERANRGYAGMFVLEPIVHAYFEGRADVYVELLAQLRAMNGYIPPPKMEEPQ